MLLDHVTIRTVLLRETRDFFADVFELTEGSRPEAINRIPGYWLYADGEPIVHIVASRGGTGSGDAATEAIDHVAFRLQDFAAFKSRLSRHSIPHSDMTLPELSERRVFLRAPGGPLIEVVFREALAVQRAPPLV